MARGRYRSFYQCDLDIAGDYGLMIPDAEILNITSEIIEQFGFKFTIKFNHKCLLDLVLGLCNVPAEKYMTTCSSIDKLDKEPWSNVAEELALKGLDATTIDNIKEHITVSGEPRTILALLRTKYSTNVQIMKVLDDIDLLFKYLESFNSLKNITFDMSLCRGLSYYTGIIFEAILLDNDVGVGSIAAGGRYDNLIGTFGKSQIPAVGCSIGVERLYAIMEARSNMAEQKSETQVFVTHIGSQDMMFKSLEVCKTLWANGFVTEFPYKQQKMKDQIETVLKKGIPLMILVAETELAKGNVLVKDIVNKVQTEVPIVDIVAFLNSKLKQ